MAGVVDVVAGVVVGFSVVVEGLGVVGAVSHDDPL